MDTELYPFLIFHIYSNYLYQALYFKDFGFNIELHKIEYIICPRFLLFNIRFFSTLLINIIFNFS